MKTQFSLLAILILAMACANENAAPPGPDEPTDTTEDPVDPGSNEAGMPDAPEDPDPTGPSCDIPSRPYGTRAGATFEPLTLEQCDGTPYDFYGEDFCDATLTVLSIAAGWCAPCIIESQQLTERITEAYRARGVRVIQVLTQDQTYAAPTSDFCTAWVNSFGLTNIELMDPVQLTQVYFPGNSLPATIIVDAEGTIRFRENGATQGLVSLRNALNGLLAEAAP